MRFNEAIVIAQPTMTLNSFHALISEETVHNKNQKYKEATEQTNAN